MVPGRGRAGSILRPPRGARPEDRVSPAPTRRQVLPARAQQDCAPTPAATGSLTLWLWVAAGFLLLALAWAVLFTAARSANVKSVPLVTKGGGP